MLSRGIIGLLVSAFLGASGLDALAHPPKGPPPHVEFQGRRGLPGPRRHGMRVPERRHIESAALRGERLIREGEHRVRRGEALVRRGQMTYQFFWVREGEALIREGRALIREGTALQRRGPRHHWR